MKSKNRDRDRWATHLRAPYERVFAQRPKRVRYRGVAKNQFAAFLQAMVCNLKRLVALDANFVAAYAQGTVHGPCLTGGPLLPEPHSGPPEGACRTRRRASQTVGEIVWAIVVLPEAAQRFLQRPQ